MKLPQGIVDVIPPGATPVPPFSYSSIMDGIHTGGGYVTQDEQGRMVFLKPLDARPYINCDYRVPTHEAEFLEEVKHPAFPEPYGRLSVGCDIREKTAQGETINAKTREFLALPWLYIGPPTEIGRAIKRDDIEQLIDGIRYANRLGWKIDDDLYVGFDVDHDYNLVWFDFSCAHFIGAPMASADSDEYLVEKFLERLPGWNAYVYSMSLGRKLIDLARYCDASKHNIDLIARYAAPSRSVPADKQIDLGQLWDNPYFYKGSWRFAYASFNRPLSNLWASFEGVDVFLYQFKKASWSEGVPFTIILADKALPKEKIYSYELVKMYEKWIY